MEPKKPRAPKKVKSVEAVVVIAEEVSEDSTSLVVYNSEQLDSVVAESNLPTDEATLIKQSYTSFFQQLAEIKAIAAGINYENPTLIDEGCARDMRLRTVKVRTSCEAIKDNRKKIHLLKANVEQAAFNLIKADCLLDEEKYLQVEKNRQIKQQKEEAQLNELRINQCENVKEFIPIGLELGRLSQEDFDKLLKGANLQAAAAKAEAEASRIAAEEAKAKADAEAEALKKAQIEAAEKAAAEAKAQAEAAFKLARETEAAAKEAAEKAAAEAEAAAKSAAAAAAKAKEESDKAIAKAQAEAAAAAAEKAKAEAEMKVIQAEAAAKAKAILDAKLAAEKELELAEAAPDKEKLIQIGQSIRKLITEMPVVKTKKSQKIVDEVKLQLENTIYDLKQLITKSNDK
jgi:hypothetical protein